MKNGKPTVISLFSGCGGSSLGYKWAGFKELLAIDFDRIAIETFKLNFPTVPCWQRDIKEITGKEVMEFCRIEKRGLDLLDASPPCQGFSNTGKRIINDKRNDLFKEFVKFIKELEPKTFIMENVTGMLRGKLKGRFIEIMVELKSLPYRVKCKRMNARYYKVPQARPRLIWLGIRKDLMKEPAFPKPNNKFIKVIDIIGKLPPQEVPTDKTELFMEYWKKAGYGKPVGKFLTRKKLHPNRPAPTIVASRPHYHYEYSRSLSSLEMALLQSFPEDFKFSGNYYQQIMQIGNSVPPKFMEAIAKTVKEEILSHAPIS